MNVKFVKNVKHKDCNMDQKLIDKGEKLKLKYKSNLKFAENVEIKSLGDIIFMLFFIKLDNWISDTYWKRKNKYYLQKTGSARSIEDCYLLAISYIPDINYEQVDKAVELFYNDEYMIGQWYCTTVKRRVHSRNCYNNITTHNINNRLNIANLNVYVPIVK